MYARTLTHEKNTPTQNRARSRAQYEKAAITRARTLTRTHMAHPFSSCNGGSRIRTLVHIAYTRVRKRSHPLMYARTSVVRPAVLGQPVPHVSAYTRERK